ncbi:MAG: APC family permease [Thermaerobacter sp.]|nr:APC family permease [Thermaerobacter sp.]
MSKREMGFKHELGLIDLTFASLGGIIGSGWILASLFASGVAGPAAIISWIIGGIAVLLLGLVYSELGGALPEAGGIARYPQYSHGTLVSWVMGWAAWLTYVTVAPAEAEAIVQIVNSYYPHFYNATKGVMTSAGFAFAVVLTIIFFVVNYYGIGMFKKVNTTATWFKLVVPAGTALILIAVAHHFGNITNPHFGGFAPSGFAASLTAVGTTGIVFAYLGFRQAIDLAGEAKNPTRDVPRAIIIAILIGIVVYMLLEISFLVGVDPASLAKYGWSGLTKYTAISSFPFAGIASLLGLGWLSVILTVDGFVSPGGTGVVYTASTSRLVFALAENGYLPPGLMKLHQKFAVPANALWLNLIAGIVAMGPFPAWSKIIGFISITGFFAYITGPVALMVLRKTAPNLNRPVKLGGANIITLLSFIIGSLIIYWASWGFNKYALGAIAIGVVIYAFMYFTGRGKAKEVKSGIWLVVYLVVMGLMSYFGSTTFGGTNAIPAPWDTVSIVVLSIVFFYWGIGSGIPNDELEILVKDLD